jgi:hypothetical protein
MTKEYRDELKTLRKAKKKILSDQQKQDREIQREITKLAKQSARGVQASRKAIAQIEKREAILQGRLA